MWRLPLFSRSARGVRTPAAQGQASANAPEQFDDDAAKFRMEKLRESTRIFARKLRFKPLASG
jgi:hypothetical protein